MKITFNGSGLGNRGHSRGGYLDTFRAYQDVVYELYGHDVFYELQGNTQERLLLVFNQETHKLHLVNVRLYSRTYSTGRRDRDGKDIKETEYEIRDYEEVEVINLGKSVEVDYLMFKAYVYLSGTDKLEVINSQRGTNAKRLVDEFKENGIEVIELERHWFNKIIGFRSKNIFKGTIAIIIYLAIMLGIVYLIYSNFII